MTHSTESAEEPRSCEQIQTPLKLTAIVASLMMYRCSQGRIIPQITSNKNCDKTGIRATSVEEMRDHDKKADKYYWVYWFASN